MSFTNASTGFQNPVIAGSGELVIDDIHSRAYTPGVAGWSINRDGSAEFNDVTIRGDLSLSAQYAPVTSFYDASGGGGPLWNVTGSYVLFLNAAWGPVTLPCPVSGRFRWDIQLQGMNKNAAAATLSVAVEVQESSTPGGGAFVPPGTTIFVPSLSNSALASCQVTGTAAQMRPCNYGIIDALTPGNWYRFRMWWRISSGSAIDITFPDLASKFTITPMV